ncbi:MAG TPA: DNA polymerase III subunit delta [Verrucomicrobiae bacterium]|nr:DNA polymerase III subunit delta [Verrucomicrobiae bacterium]
MAGKAANPASPLVLVCGDDDYAVKKRARQLYDAWCAELGGMDHEIIDATVSNSGEALKSIARLFEALNTLPFFGGAKAVWLQNCNFLGDERAASAQAVTEALAGLAQTLKSFRWDNVRLLISAGKVDKRKAFYKTLEKAGTVESYAGLSADDRDWAGQAETFVARQLRGVGKEISDEALAEFVARVGPNMRQLDSEAEKIALYVGERAAIESVDVATVTTANKQARAFALADALGNRDLPRLLRTLDEELWEMKLDSQKSPIGLLYGIITKVRVMILLKELVRDGLLKAEADYNRFKAQIERLPAERLPTDKRYNPQAVNAFVLFRALPQSRRYSLDELVRAMELLLECNQKLVGSSLEASLVLQQTLVRIVEPATERATAR